MIRLQANCASTWANHTSGSAGQKVGSFRVTTAEMSPEVGVVIVAAAEEEECEPNRKGYNDTSSKFTTIPTESPCLTHVSQLSPPTMQPCAIIPYTPASHMPFACLLSPFILFFSDTFLVHPWHPLLAYSFIVPYPGRAPCLSHVFQLDPPWCT